MGVKMDLRIITKNHAADPEIGFLTKSISRPCRNGHAASVGVKSSELRMMPMGTPSEPPKFSCAILNDAFVIFCHI